MTLDFTCDANAFNSVRSREASPAPVRAYHGRRIRSLERNRLTRTDIPLRDLLNVAIDAAYLAGRRTLAYFNAEVAVENKADSTPVTVKKVTGVDP